MARHARIGNAGKGAELGDGIAMANAAGLYADAHLTGPRLGKLLLHHFKGSAGGGNLHCTSKNGRHDNVFSCGLDVDRCGQDAGWICRAEKAAEIKPEYCSGAKAPVIPWLHAGVKTPASLRIARQSLYLNCHARIPTRRRTDGPAREGRGGDYPRRATCASALKRAAKPDGLCASKPASTPPRPTCTWATPC